MNKNSIFVATSEICYVLNDYFKNVVPNLRAKIDNDLSAPNSILSKTKSLFF